MNFAFKVVGCSILVHSHTSFFGVFGQGLTLYPWLTSTQEITSVCLLSAGFKGMPLGAQQEKVMAKCYEVGGAYVGFNSSNQLFLKFS